MDWVAPPRAGATQSISVLEQILGRKGCDATELSDRLAPCALAATAPHQQVVPAVTLEEREPLGVFFCDGSAHRILGGD